jgi:hypothetical protein
MTEYHKIDSVFKRDPATNHKALLLGDYAQEAFAYLANNEWVFTEKVDGTNIRIIIAPRIAGGDIKFGGRTDSASIPALLVTRLQERFLSQKETLNEMFENGAVLYGEGYGARIQKGGGNYRPDQDFVLFDAMVGHWWLQRDALEGIAASLKIDIVPVLGRGTLADMVSITRSGFFSQWGNFIAEGIVARPAVELKNRNGSRIITKIKHKDFASLAVAA